MKSVMEWLLVTALFVLAPSTMIAASPTIFSDSLGSGWSYIPWSGMSANLSSPVHRAGSTGIDITMTAPSGFNVQASGGFNTSGQQSLHVSIFNVSGDGNAFYIALCDMTGAPIHYIRVADYTGAGQLYTFAWYDLIIPLADLQATNQTIGGMVVQIAGTGRFFLDEISFSTVAGSTYWVPPTVTSVTVSCTAASLVVNGTAQCSKTVTGTGNPDTSVTWYVNGIQNGNSTVGAIPPGYVSPPYTAPSAVPSPATVTITATSVLDPTKSGSTTITIAPPPPIQASDAVFTDAMWTGWTIGNWSQVTVDPMADTLYRGIYGMQVQIATPSSGRVQLIAQSGYKFNTAGYDSISLVLNIGTYENESLTLGLLNSSGSVIQYVSLANYTPTRTLDNSYAYRWQPFRIPLADLGATNADVYGVEVQSVAPSTFFLDDVMFQPTGGCNGK